MTAYDDWLAAAAAHRREVGLERVLRSRAATDALIDLAGNDYLGLSRHPQVIAGAVAAATEWGGGAAASRLVSGTLGLHDQLEHALAAHTGFRSALVTSTGYHANLAVVQALTDQDTLVVSDAHVHASMIDGCRLARVPVEVAPHRDVAAVEAALSGRAQTRALVLVESIYSVLGDAAPVAALADVCARHDALLVVDEAHALGVVGPAGAGLCAEAGVQDHVVATLTLSKSLGSQGGAVLASPAVRDHLVNRARPFIYDTGLAPAATGAALAALQVVRDEPARLSRVHEVAAALAEACGVPAPAGAVLAAPMPSPQAAVAAVERAAALGVRIGCFRPPSTPDGVSRLRLTAHAHLTDAEIDRACAVLREVTP